MTAIRFSIPAAYIDPAFRRCLDEAIATPELLSQFDRLYGARVSTGSPSESDMRAFAAFVHDSVYLRLPDAAIEALRHTRRETEANHA